MYYFPPCNTCPREQTYLDSTFCTAVTILNVPMNYIPYSPQFRHSHLGPPMQESRVIFVTTKFYTDSLLKRNVTFADRVRVDNSMLTKI